MKMTTPPYLQGNSSSAPLPTTAWGLENGVRIEVKLPKWAEAHSFWGVWEACHHLSATAEVAEKAAVDKVAEPELDSASAVSSINERAILESQMMLGSESIPKLSRSQLLLCDPIKVAALQPFKNPTEAAAWAALESDLAYDPLFLDLTSNDRRRTISMPVGMELPWLMSAALVENNRGALAITVFGAQSQSDEPPSIPQGRILFGAAPMLPTPRLGELAVDVVSGQTYAPSANPHSELVKRSVACFHLAIGVIGILKSIQDETIQMKPLYTNPKQKAAAKKAGQKIPLLIS